MQKNLLNRQKQLETINKLPSLKERGLGRGMKTQFKYHIKFGSCWYDNFFKVTTRQIQNNKLDLIKSNKKLKENEHKK